MSTTTVVEASAFDGVISYRQLDHWTTAGYLRIVPGTGNGAGNRRRWPAREVEIATIMSRCIEAGLNVAAANRVAREGGRLTAHVTVTVHP